MFFILYLKNKKLKTKCGLKHILTQGDMENRLNCIQVMRTSEINSFYVQYKC